MLWTSSASTPIDKKIYIEISRIFFSIGGTSYLRIDLVGDAPIVQETMATPMIEKSTESSFSINLDDDPTKNGFLHQNDSDRLLELINSPPPSMVSSGILLTNLK